MVDPDVPPLPADDPEAGNTPDDPASDPGRLRDRLAACTAELEMARNRELTLHGEFRRRVRNVLAITRSVFMRTVAAGGSVEDVADHFKGRLDALARYRQGWADDQMRQVDVELLVRNEFHEFRFGDDERITLAGPDAMVSQDVAQLLGLALHELITNALKFGALSTDGGRLSLGWTVSDDRLRLSWEESGVAVLASAPTHRGFGREYVEEALPYQVGADTRFELRPGGLFCEIDLPADASLSAGASSRLLGY